MIGYCAMTVAGGLKIVKFTLLKRGQKVTLVVLSSAEYGGPQLSQQQQITHSTNQDIHSNNK